MSAQCVKGQFRSATAARGTFAHLLHAGGRGSREARFATTRLAYLADHHFATSSLTLASLADDRYG